MKLQLLIPQYNEDDEIVESMLDSISIQQGIDFKDIEVLFGNDGSDTKLSDLLVNSYPFSIKYYQFEHTSPAGTRQKLFEKATADYVMFCDADDMFLTALALYTIFHYMEKGFDALVCDFTEQLINKETGKSSFFTHKRDYTFVHGKVYRRQHIIDNNIEWRADIRYHEDGSYNLLAIYTAKQLEHCNIPLYLWKWRDGSICRKDPLYVLKTYTRMIYSNGYLVKDFLDREMYEKAKFFVASLTYGTYYMLNKPIWLDPMNAKYRYETEKCFQKYFKVHKQIFNSIEDKTKQQVIAGTKRRVLNEDVLLEKFTFDEWINHIEELE